MCGICGILDLEGRQINPLLIKNMANALTHRGPDDEGVYSSSKFRVQSSESSPTVALGHRRLSIIDLNSGHQPMTNEDGSIALVYNGEIYNFKELRQDLIKRGHTFKTNSDTEVILHQYEEDGWRCVERFNSIFAFALWDEKKKILLLARDRMGVKPLYYAWDDKRLIFASEIKPILLVLNRIPDIDRSSIFMLMTLQFIPSPGSIFKGIEKLLPGSVMVCNQDQHRVERYWDIKDVSPFDKSALPSFPEKYLYSLLKESVEGQLISDVPVGAFLSGGVDSSAITGFMSRAMPGRIKTFSVGFKDAGRHNELGYARLVARHFNTDHHEISIGPKDVIGVMPDAVLYLDDPIVDPAILPTYIVSRLASSEVKVVLTGEGADELFGGYKRYQLDRIAAYYKFIPSFIRKVLLETGGGRMLNRRYMQGLSAISHTDPLLRHIGWVSILDRGDLARLFGGSLSVEDEYKRIIDYFDRFFLRNSDDPLRSMLTADMCGWLPDDLLVKVDRMSMANSLEARVPYLDNRLVDFALRIPMSSKIRRLRGKEILKRSLSGILPEEILRRPKMGFTPPIASWFRDELKDYLKGSISKKAIEPIGLFDYSFIEIMIKRHMDGVDYSLPLWGILTLSFWHDSLKELRTSPC